MTHETGERRYAKDVADWCQRELDTARRTGNLETRPLVQNIELIIKALRAFSVGETTNCNATKEKQK